MAFQGRISPAEKLKPGHYTLVITASNSAGAAVAELHDLGMSGQRRQLLPRAYEAFNVRDVQGVLATMHPDVDWPNAMEGGHVPSQ